MHPQKDWIPEFMGENATYHDVVDHVGAPLAISSAIRKTCKNKGEIYNKIQEISI